MEKKASLKGIRIRTVNLIMLVVSLLLFIVVLFTTVQIAGEYKKSVAATEDYINWEKAAHTMHVASDYLTEQARLYVETHKKEYADNYFTELLTTHNREKALEFLTRNNVDEEERANLQKALEVSNQLANREIYAIRLVADAIGQNLAKFPPAVGDVELSEPDMALDAKGKLEAARHLMFNPEYGETKREIMADINKFLEHNLERTKEAQRAQSGRLGSVLRQQRLALIFLFFLNIMTFSMIILLIVKPLQIYLKCIRDDKMFEMVGAYEFKHLALTYNDIFAMKEHQDKILKHKAEHDPLTGLMNRGAFQSLGQVLKNASDPVGLMLVDVDKFKEVNDNWGHMTGDRILCKVANLLKNAFRSDDFCIRLGGDEFAVVFKNLNPDMEDIIRDKVEAINKTLQNPDDGLPKESISVGVAFSDGGFPDSLYNDADSALYAVKERGRRGIEFFHNLPKPEKKPQDN